MTMSQESHAQTSPNTCSLCTLPVAMSCTSHPSGSVAICHVLPVLWSTSCFHNMEWDPVAVSTASVVSVVPILDEFIVQGLPGEQKMQDWNLMDQTAGSSMTI